MESTPKRKRKERRRRRPPPGEIPGALVEVPDAPPASITARRYDIDGVEAIALEPPDLHNAVRQGSVLWIDIEGNRDIGLLSTIGRAFGLHALALEDAVHGGQRAKVDHYGDSLYIALPTAVGPFETDQLNIFVGDDYVITIHQTACQAVQLIAERLRLGAGQLRKRGADYLAYALIDSAVDHFEPWLDIVSDEIDYLELEVFNVTSKTVLGRIQPVRSQLHRMLRTGRALREMLTRMQHGELPVVTADTRVYLRDCHDHTVRLVERTEAYRDLASDLMQTHLALANQHLSEVMKLLTIISTVFIPLGFIVGLYGMNFSNMPELSWQYGYPVALGLMATVATSLLLYFRRRGWLGGQAATPDSTQ